MLAILLMAAAALAPSGQRFVGSVVRAEASSRALLVQLDGGGEKWIAAPQALEILRVAPGETGIEKAARVAFEEVRAGDRVLARSASETSGVAVAEQIVIVSHAELARQRAAERADWKARGVSGRITAIDPEKGEITILTPARPVATAMVIEVTAKTGQRRYRADSARYSDAAPASFAQIRVGDQVQALGRRAGDGKRFAAEKLVSGSFRNFAAKTGAVNAAAREITVERVEGGPPVVVKIGPACVLLKLRPEAAAALARKAEDPQAILENSPAMAPEVLKEGDAVIIATGADGARDGALIPAIAVIAGVEPLLKHNGKGRQEIPGSWNLALDPDSTGGRGNQ